MGDDDNYTIEEVDEAPDEGLAGSSDGGISRRAVPVMVVMLGVVTILAAAWCQTSQSAFFNNDPDKSSLFVFGLVQPLGIIGALLVVAGICAIAFRIAIGDERERVRPVSDQVSGGAIQSETEPS